MWIIRNFLTQRYNTKQIEPHSSCTFLVHLWKLNTPIQSNVNILSSNCWYKYRWHYFFFFIYCYSYSAFMLQTQNQLNTMTIAHITMFSHAQDVICCIVYTMLNKLNNDDFTFTVFCAWEMKNIDLPLQYLTNEEC